MIARTATESRYSHGLMLPHADLLAAALRAIRATADGARWAIWRWYQVRRTTRQLSHLPDHMLKDIGLSRSMLISASMRRVREEEEVRRCLNAYWISKAPPCSESQRRLALDLRLVQVHVEAGRVGRPQHPPLGHERVRQKMLVDRVPLHQEFLIGRVDR
jgi:uncharacterized protein YjiS (DUF1127 family)